MQLDSLRDGLYTSIKVVFGGKMFDGREKAFETRQFLDQDTRFMNHGIGRSERKLTN